MNANEDYLAYAPEEDTEWSFSIPIQSDCVSGLFEETVTLINGCFEASSGFLYPTEVECLFLTLEKDVSIEELADIDAGERHKVQTTVSSRDGLSSEEVESIIRGYDTAEVSFKWLPTVRFRRPNVSVELVDGEHLIKRSSNLYQERDETETPADAPLEFTIGNYCNRTNPMHTVSIHLHTDIWFEDSELGAANRNRLREFLERMKSTLNTTDWDYWSNSHAIPFELD